MLHFVLSISSSIAFFLDTFYHKYSALSFLVMIL